MLSYNSWLHLKPRVRKKYTLIIWHYFSRKECKKNEKYLIKH